MSILVTNPLLKVCKLPSYAFLLFVEMRKALINADPSLLTAKLDLNFTELHLAASLLSRPVYLSDHWDIEKLISLSITSVYLQNDYLVVTLSNLSTQSFPLSLVKSIISTFCTNNSENAFDYFYLITADMIRQGYTVSESIGESISITSPKSVTHTTDLNLCSCGGYEKVLCNHMVFAQTYLNSRHIFNAFV